MVFEKIRAIISEQFGIDEDDVTLDVNLDDLGADSLDLIDIAMSIEDEFNTEVPDEALEKFSTIEDIVKFIEEV